MGHLLRTLFCPSLACKGEFRVHDSNGTFVALAEEGSVLYARCSDSSCTCSEEDVKSGWMDVVDGTGRRPWVRLTAAKLAEVESRIQYAGKKKRKS